ncbi:MAG TPA: hypothetical protein PKA28_01390 [Methylomusa anaerophila]|uniref:CSL zinc finger n=1 Tax=Methylomusa anaerophila TaxID=1930071 RepID=A0A348APT4_9FIRM|nr:hypothetical protein [Methylomusa anaerophila]BBB93082.1 CSL zinc finger [Methylomusa anaerophila]HML87085.1 hypothetical protein [Methylomusa anaerophila]
MSNIIDFDSRKKIQNEAKAAQTLQLTCPCRNNTFTFSLLNLKTRRFVLQCTRCSQIIDVGEMLKEILNQDKNQTY